MVLTPFPMVKFAREVQYQKACRPMCVTLSGIVMLVREEQLSNAPVSINLTLLGITTLVMDLHSKNASIPMLVTGSFLYVDGITISVSEQVPMSSTEYEVPSLFSRKRRPSLGETSSAATVDMTMFIIIDKHSNVAIILLICFIFFTLVFCLHSKHHYHVNCVFSAYAARSPVISALVISPSPLTSAAMD